MDRVQDLEKHRKALEEARLHGKTSNKPKSSGTRAYLRADRSQSIWSKLFNTIHYKSEEERKKLRLMFNMAGWRSENSLLIYGCAKLFIIFPVGFSVWTYIQYYTEWGLMMEVGGIIAAALLSSYAVDWCVKYAVKRRQRAIARAFPDALDLMVICAEAGLSLSAIIQRVSKDIAQIHPDLGYEMGLLAIELNMLSSRKEALENFSKRLQSAICKNIVGNLLQSEQYGTAISQTMRTLAEEFRFERLMTAEERAAKLPVLLAAPLVLFIFPSLFIIILGPAIINVMSHFN